MKGRVTLPVVEVGLLVTELIASALMDAWDVVAAGTAAAARAWVRSGSAAAVLFKAFTIAALAGTVGSVRAGPACP